MPGDATVGEFGERRLIRLLRDRFPRMALAGDDSAVLPSLTCPVVTTDSFIESRHFYRWWCDPHVLGRRLLEATLSDLAAMGARPGWVFSALGLPAGLEVSWIVDFYRGLTAREDSPVAGGEIVRSDTLWVTLTAAGEGSDPSRLMRRSGLHSGDFLWVTGQVGRALDAPGLLEMAGGLCGSTLEPVRGELDDRQLCQVRAFLEPRAAFPEAALLVDRGVRTAIDISDGLVSEAAHLAEESRVDAWLDLDSTPFFESVADRPLEAASAGEDFVLVFGAGPEEDFTGQGFTRVGEARPGDGRVHVLLDGTETDPGSAGYDHFG
jgi:thiamine-monophosphate kinase